MARRFRKPSEPKGPKYASAPEVQELAKKLIEDHHGHLTEARIVYLFRNGKWSKKGKTTLGQAKLAAEDARFIGQYDFVVIINMTAWNNACAAVREALVDHELYHCLREDDRAGNPKYSIADHDVQEFVGIVRRHGVWADDLQRMMKAAAEGPVVTEDIADSGDLFKGVAGDGAGGEKPAPCPGCDYWGEVLANGKPVRNGDGDVIKGCTIVYGESDEPCGPANGYRDFAGEVADGADSLVGGEHEAAQEGQAADSAALVDGQGGEQPATSAQ